MVKAYRHQWALLDVLGMVLLAAGAFVIVTQFPFPRIAEIVLVIGIIIIVVSSFFIFLEGRKLRKEDEKFRRFEKKRASARQVPNDLEEGYLIDYTADPDQVVSFKSNDARSVCAEQGIRSDDIVFIYPK